MSINEFENNIKDVARESPSDEEPVEVDSSTLNEVNSALGDYQSEYTQTGFWAKVVKFAKSAGKEVIEKSLILYYVAQSDKTPLWAKTMVFSALGYFINTIDAIPDITPLVGFADDLGVLAAVLALVARFINPGVKEQVDTKLADWFADEVEKEKKNE